MEEARPWKSEVRFQATRGQRAASFQEGQAANERFQVPATPVPSQPGQRRPVRHAAGQKFSFRSLAC